MLEQRGRERRRKPEYGVRSRFNDGHLDGDEGSCLVGEVDTTTPAKCEGEACSHGGGDDINCKELGSCHGQTARWSKSCGMSLFAQNQAQSRWIH